MWSSNAIKALNPYQNGCNDQRQADHHRRNWLSFAMSVRVVLVRRLNRELQAEEYDRELTTSEEDSMPSATKAKECPTTPATHLK